MARRSWARPMSAATILPTLMSAFIGRAAFADDCRHALTPASGAFTRATSAWVRSGQSMLEAVPASPRLTNVLSCGAPDGEIRLRELPGGLDAKPWCATAAGLFALAGNTFNDTVYRSADGIQGWAVAGKPYPGHNLESVFALRSGRLIAFAHTTSDIVIPFLSDNAGTSWTRCSNSAGGDPEFSSRPYVWSFHEAPHGTIAAVTYTSDTMPKQIWRSEDGGQTWTKALEVTPSFIRHFHAIIYHPGMQMWLADTGDGVAKRYTYVSYDDARTWDHYAYKGATPRYSVTGQVTRFRDYGHPTRLLLASDHYHRVGWVDLATWQSGSFLSPAHYDNSNNFDFEAFQHAGLWYACSMGDNPYSPRTAVILVSPDLENWSTFYRFTDPQMRGVIHCAGFVGGKLHMMVQTNGFSHLAISPARVAMQPGLMLSPAKTNLCTEAQSKCASTTGWTTWGVGSALTLDAGVSFVAGAGSIRFQNSGAPADCGLQSPAIPVEVGKTYVAEAWVRTDNSPHSVNCTIDGGYAFPNGLRPDGEWTLIRSAPYQVNSSAKRIQISAYTNNYSNTARLWVGAVQLTEVPLAPWAAGGAAQAAETLAHAVTLREEWTHVFSARLYPGDIDDRLSERGTIQIAGLESAPPFTTLTSPAEAFAPEMVGRALRILSTNGFDGDTCTITGYVGPGEITVDRPVASGPEPVTNGSGSISRPLHLASYVIDDDNHVELFFDAADHTFRLRTSSGGQTTAVIQSAARWNHRDATVKFAVRYTPGRFRLSLSDGTAPEHVAALLVRTGPAMHGPGRIIRTGSHDGSGVLPHMLFESFLYDYAMADAEVESVFASPAIADLPPLGSTPGDLDHDGDVDGADFGVFAGCFNGTGNRIQLGCAKADFDGDAYVDGVDFGLFAGCFNGSGNPPACR